MASEARYLQLTFGLAVGAILACGIYASIDARGLYHDGVYYLYRVAEREGFYLVDPARTTVQVLRQTPIVVLSKLSDLSLFRRGQVFSLTLLTLPTLICALCWFTVPRERKTWVLFPVAYLLIGFEATSMHAIGEAAIAASYFWIMLFMLLFRTRDIGGQALFLFLCVPAFALHEAAFPLMTVLLFACATKARIADSLAQRVFLAVSALLIIAIIGYELSWTIYPRLPADRDGILHGLSKFQFLYFEGHVNLPLITGTVALIALGGTFFANFALPQKTGLVFSRTIAIGFGLFALAATVASLSIEQTFAPFAQLQARYHPVFVSTVLGSGMVLLVAFRISDRFWVQPATFSIILTLCVAQTAADIAATRRWHDHVKDLRALLASAHGLVRWNDTIFTGDTRRDLDWRLMSTEWVISLSSIVYSRNGVVQSIIGMPSTMTEQAVDPSKVNSLPILRRIDYTSYRQSFYEQKFPP